MARGRSFRGQLRSRRPTDWLSTAPGTIITATSGGDPAVVLAILVAETAAPVGTIIRVRGNVRIEHNATNAGTQFWGLGLCLITDVEGTVAAGGGLPHPIADADSERWMWTSYGFVSNNGVNTDTEVAGIQYERVAIDSKAMRRWDENQRLVLLLENDALAGTADLVVAMGFLRVLMKLP